MKLIVASTNPVKIAAAKNAFARAFPTVEWLVEGVTAASGVSDQPMTYEETLRGAQNRLAYLIEHTPPPQTFGLRLKADWKMCGGIWKVSRMLSFAIKNVPALLTPDRFGYLPRSSNW